MVTDIYLAQFYHSDPADAHQSVVYIITTAPFGDLVRSVHFGTAQVVGALGAWFSSELGRTVPLLPRLFVGHATIP